MDSPVSIDIVVGGRGSQDGEEPTGAGQSTSNEPDSGVSLIAPFTSTLPITP